MDATEHRAAKPDVMAQVAVMLQEARADERERVLNAIGELKYPPESVLQSTDRLIYNTAISDAMQAGRDA